MRGVEARVEPGWRRRRTEGAGRRSASLGDPEWNWGRQEGLGGEESGCQTLDFRPPSRKKLSNKAFLPRAVCFSPLLESKHFPLQGQSREGEEREARVPGPPKATNRGSQAPSQRAGLAESVLRRQPGFSHKQGEAKTRSLWITIFIQQQLSGGSSAESAFNSSCSSAGGLRRAPCCMLI